MAEKLDEKTDKDDQEELEHLFPQFKLKSNCYSAKNKYPRTTNNQMFVDWSKSPMHGGKKNFYSKLVEPVEPGPPWRRFRPLPPIPHREEEYKVRTKVIQDRRGLRTPEDSFHLGYKHFSLNAVQKKFRHYNDPIPHPLITEARFAFQDPNGEVRAHMKVPGVNYHRYGLTPFNYLFGIAPEILAIPPEFPTGPPKKVL